MRVPGFALLAVVGLLLLLSGISLFSLDAGRILPMKLVQGGGREQAQELVVDRFRQGRAIASSGEISLSADAYSFLNYSVSGPIGGRSDLLLFWRSRERAGEISTLPLPVSPIGTIDLTEESEWRGNIAEIGFVIYGTSGQVYRLRASRLYPDGWVGRLLWHIGGWLEFEPWSQRSINFLAGGRRGQQLHLPLLVLLVVVLLGAVALLFRRGRRSSGVRWSLFLAVILAGWLLLDARWLYNQVRQFQLTNERFAGRSEQQRQLRAEDGDLYGYAERLKRDILPRHPTRIFIISEAPANDYQRLRLKYHLAPHNILNEGHRPKHVYQKTGGYLLVLHDIKGLSYDKSGGLLRWGRNGALKATLIDRGAWATLYRIEPG